jgi:hypothetical protein
VSRWLMSAIAGSLSLVLADAAQADTCIVKVGNGAGGQLVSVTVRAAYASPGSVADRNLPVILERPLEKDQIAGIRWDCPSNNVLYTVTGTFANAIRATSEPFKPQAGFASGEPETAWVR